MSYGKQVMTSWKPFGTPAIETFRSMYISSNNNRTLAPCSSLFGLIIWPRGVH